jgi:ribonuclease E
MLQALAEKRIGRRDQANAWIWQLAEYTREVHEEYAVQRWPETKRLLGLLVNSSGQAHARNARRLVHAARKQDRRLSAALLAAALAHTPEAQQALDGARTRMARKPSALARELLKNFPKGRRRGRGRRRGGGGGKGGGNAQASGRSGANGKPKTAEAPDEKVLDEALAPEAIEAGAEPAEAPLDDEGHETLEHEVADRVDEALEDKGEDDASAAAAG